MHQFSAISRVTISGDSLTVESSGSFPVTALRDLENTGDNQNILGDVPNDTINISANSATLYYSGVLSSDHTAIVVTNGTTSFILSQSTFAVGQSLTFEPVTPGAGGANQFDLLNDTVLNPTCFLAGTMIATPKGEVPIETLAIKDIVLTDEGRAVSALWIGRQTVATYFADPLRGAVQIAAGALADGVPSRDLRVTSDHALLIDGVLCHAGALLNGTTIRRMSRAELGERFAVYHIETEDHSIILAEGAPAETFVDNVTRRRFDNYAEFEALFGTEERPVPELAYPRVMSARQVPPGIRAKLAARAQLRAALKIEEAA